MSMIECQTSEILEIKKEMFEIGCFNDSNNVHILDVLAHTGCLDPPKILSTIDAPPGVPGVSKNHIFFSTNETVFLLR